WGASEKGRTWFNSTSNQIKYFDGSTTQTIAPSGTGFIDGGNSFGAAAVLGTNDSFALQFETNNTKHMTILPSGNVGIGTETPGSKFEVVNAANQKFWIDQSSASRTRAISYGSNEGILIATDSATAANSAWLYDGGSGSASILGTSRNKMHFMVNANYGSTPLSSSKMVIDNTGSVGIGTI